MLGAEHSMKKVKFGMDSTISVWTENSLKPSRNFRNFGNEIFGNQHINSLKLVWIFSLPVFWFVIRYRVFSSVTKPNPPLEELTSIKSIVNLTHTEKGTTWNWALGRFANFSFWPIAKVFWILIGVWCWETHGFSFLRKPLYKLYDYVWNWKMGCCITTDGARLKPNPWRKAFNCCRWQEI